MTDSDDIFTEFIDTDSKQRYPFKIRYHYDNAGRRIGETLTYLGPPGQQMNGREYTQYIMDLKSYDKSSRKIYSCGYNYAHKNWKLIPHNDSNAVHTPQKHMCGPCKQKLDSYQQPAKDQKIIRDLFKMNERNRK